jgi:hypothetical protein
MKEKINPRFSILCSLILFAAFSRLIPHMPNFSPLGAIGLFGAAYFAKKWQAFFIPIAATWLSDLFLNNIVYAPSYSGFTWFYNGFYWQYGSYLLITIAGVFILKKTDPQRIMGAALFASAIFFLVSNFGCWIGSATYPQDITGLMACYAAGIPFLKATLLGDLFYSVALFGLFAWAQKQFPVMQVKNG